MNLYLQKHPAGKKFHDPLAACVAINRDLATFRPVELYQKNCEWGSRLVEEGNTFITIAVDRELFLQPLVAC